MRGYIQISKDQLITNYQKLKEETKKDVICVIKTNAYGHGLIEVAKILSTQNPKMFAVSTLEEGILIRKNLIFTPILLLGYCDNFIYASNFRITLTIINLDYLKKVQKANIPIFIHLLINTGMNRDGILETEIDEALSIIKKSRLILKGIFTHFANINAYEKQNQIFLDVLNKLPTSNLIIHSQASSTILIPNEKMTAIRVGLALYGLDENIPFTRPILKLIAHPICSYNFENIENISYNQEAMPASGYVYTLPIGYGDGLKRNYKYKICVKDKTYQQIGITCMDHLMMYSDEKLSFSDDFIIIGEHNPIIQIAKENETIPYEIVSQLSSRLKRTIK